MDHLDAGVLRGQVVAKRIRAIGRSVVDEDDLEILKRLGQNAVDTIDQIVLGIVYGDDYADACHGTPLFVDKVIARCRNATRPIVNYKTILTAFETIETVLTKAPISIKQNMIWNSVGSLIYLGLQWLITIFVVRLSSGYDAAGQLSLAMAISNIFTPFAMYKVRAYQISDVRGEYAAGEYVGFRILTIAVSCVVVGIYTVITCDPSTYLVIAGYVLFKAVDVFIDVLHGVDQKHGRMDYIGQSFILRGILSFIGFCLTLYLTNDLNMAVLAMVIVTVPVAAFDVCKARQFDSLKPSFNPHLMYSLAKCCLPAVLAAFFCSAASTIPRQYLALAFGDASLGIYSSVAAPVLIVQMGASYLYNPLLVPFSQCFARGDTKGFASLFGKVTLGICALSLVCGIGFSLFGEWALALFYGDSIRPYAYLLIPMLAYTILTAYLWFFSDLLITVRGMVGNFVGNAVLFLVTIPSTFFFIQQWDMNGVSFTGIVSCLVAILVLGFALCSKVLAGKRDT